jgi:hypothetical protein
MKHLIPIPLMLLACGCSAYTGPQVRLIEQARQGLEEARLAHGQRQALVERYHQLQQSQLHDAFDLDVRQAKRLSPEWVIEHRRAYAAALDLLYRQQSASAIAGETAARNLDAVDAALQRLLHLQEIQLRALP